jgi:hypothetical protein
MSETQRPAAGWYVDPGVPDRLRYWDGTDWTEHYMPNTAPGSPQPPGQPGYPGGYVGTNGLAIASMILGIVWIFWLGSILALVFGYIALHQIKRTRESGKGMAIAGIVLGWIGVAMLILFIVLGIAGTGHVQVDRSCPGPHCGFVQSDAPVLG